MKAWLSAAALLGALAAPAGVHAHPLAPALLTFEEGAEGAVTMRWRVPLKRPTGQSLRPRIPAGCKPEGAPSRMLEANEIAVVETQQLLCPPSGLEGMEVSVDGFEDSTVNVVVRVVRPGEDAAHAILGVNRPVLSIAAGPADAPGRSFVEYLRLGIEHLLTGWDHLTFVLGLLVLFGWRRRLIAAVTAFTVGHSVTLALSVLGVVEVPQALVEALIAMTIIVLALEIQFGRHGPVWRHPWTLPGALGLLHGLGFASVLFDTGLPTDEIPLALLGFNLGLELGQLAVIAFVGLMYAVVRRALPSRGWDPRPVVAYAIGSLAAFWVIERTLAALGVVV